MDNVSFYRVAPSDCADPFDAMDNAGWYFDLGPDAWGPFDSRDEAERHAARVVASRVGP